MCILISFYEIFPMGVFNDDGFVAKIPDGRGIRHYEEVYACREIDGVHDGNGDAGIIPTSGYVQVSMLTGTTCNDDAYSDFDDHWTEYTLMGDTLEIEYLPGTFAVMKLARRHDVDAEDEPHKDLHGNVYMHRVLDARIKLKN